MRIGRLTEKALMLALGRSASVAAQFAVSLLLVRWWTADEFGRFQLVRVMVGVAALFDLGLPVGLLQATGGMTAERRQRIFRLGAAASVAVGLLVGMVLLALAPVTADAAVRRALPFAALLVAATIPAGALESILVVRERHRAAGMVALVAAVGGLAASVLVLMVHPTLAAVYGALAFAAVARLGALVPYAGLSLPRLRQPALRTWMAEAWPLVRTSLVVSANRFVGMASAQLDRVVVAALFSAATLGHYAVGAWEVPFVAIFFSAIVSAIVPEMSEHWAAGRRDDFLAVWKEAVARAAWIVFPIWLWAWIWAPEILRVLFTSRYADALPVFRAYLLMLPLRVAVYSALLVAMGAMRALLVGALLDLALNAALSVTLARLVGPVGPAAATAAATYIQVVYYLAYVRRRLAVPARRLLPWPALGRALVVAAAATLPTALLRSWRATDLVLLMLASAIAAAVVGLVMYVTAAGLFVGRAQHGR